MCLKSKENRVNYTMLMITQQAVFLAIKKTNKTN